MRSDLVGSLMIALIIACEGPSSEPTSVRTREILDTSQAKYLPYGVSVPEFSPLYLAPEPYDERRHGPSKPNSTPELNLADIPDSVTSDPGRVQRRASGLSQLLLIGGESVRGPQWASPFYNSIYGAHNTQLSMTLPAPTDTSTHRLYAPTSMPSGSACLEMATIHRRSPGQVTVHRAGWWDWCTDPNVSSFAYEESMTNSTWQSKYTRVDGFGNRNYTITIAYGHDPQGNECWSGLMYNFNTGAWESKIARCHLPGDTLNVNEDNDGWVIWEWKTDKVCPSAFARTAAYNLKVRAPTKLARHHHSRAF